MHRRMKHPSILTVLYDALETVGDYIHIDAIGGPPRDLVKHSSSVSGDGGEN